MEQICLDISDALQRGKAKEVKALCEQATEAGISAQTILEKGLLAGMNVVGEKFKNDEIFVPDVLLSARCMNKGVDVLKEQLIESGMEEKGTVILGTVAGDLHDIGKNLVKIMMEGKGLRVIDLGTDVSAEVFVQNAIDNNADVIACSALLTTTMVEMESIIRLLREKDTEGRIKVMVGGAPVNQAFCDSIGADAYTADAATAAIAALEFCEGNER